jgi:hypothetical protein
LVAPTCLSTRSIRSTIGGQACHLLRLRRRYLCWTSFHSHIRELADPVRSGKLDDFRHVICRIEQDFGGHLGDIGSGAEFSYRVNHCRSPKAGGFARRQCNLRRTGCKSLQIEPALFLCDRPFDLFQVTSNVWHEFAMCQQSLKVGRRSWIGLREFIIK